MLVVICPGRIEDGTLDGLIENFLNENATEEVFYARNTLIPSISDICLVRPRYVYQV